MERRRTSRYERLSGALRSTRRVSSADGSRNVRAISAVNILSGTYNNLVQAILQPFVIRVTGSVAALSLLQALGNRLGGGVVGALAQLGGGHLSDRWGRKPMILFGSTFFLVSLTLFLGAALTEIGYLLVPAFLFLGLGLAAAPATQSLVAESVEVPERAVAYSRVMFFFLLPSAAFAFVGGVLTDLFDYPLIFGLSLALEAASLSIYALILRETLRDRNPTPWSLRQTLRLEDPRLRAILLVTTADLFAWTTTILIIYGMAVRQFGFSNADLGLIVGVWALVFAGAVLPVGKLVQRLGTRRMIFFSESLGIPVFLGWLVASTPIGFALISIPNGLAAATWVPAFQTLVANSVGDRARAGAIGKLNAIRGLLSFPAPFVGGFLFEQYGYAAPLLASFGGVLITMGLVLRFLPEDPSRSTI